MGLSVAIKESTERFRSSASRCFTRVGLAKTACRARLLTINTEVKEYITGGGIKDVRLKRSKEMREEKKVVGRASMAILY